MNRVEITRPIVGLTRMQVCAVADATDEEILEVCNRENPSGTSNGWSKVIRVEDEYSSKDSLPVACLSYPDDRLHFLVSC